MPSANHPWEAGARAFSAFLACAISSAVSAAPQGGGDAAAADGFVGICYHDVQDVVNDPDGMAVSTANLIAQFDWLRVAGWHPVSVDDLIAAHRKQRKLPAKAVLLSFDDGYASFYRRVFPLLKLYKYPAVLGLVGQWMSGAAGSKVDYGGRPTPRERFVTWDQVREMHRSGLVEIASHSFDLHHGLRGNPQGNQMPAMSTRSFDPKRGRYESDAAYKKRLAGDFSRMARLLREELGVWARVMIWPFGRYTGQALELSAGQGMAVTLGLVDEILPATRDLSVVHRVLVAGNPHLRDFARLLQGAGIRRQMRAIHIDLDWLMPGMGDGDEAKLGRLLDRVKRLRINTVWLKCWSDDDGDDVVDRLYFPNEVLPVKADSFARVAWQLQTRAGVEVFAALPHSKQWPLSRDRLIEICAALGKHAAVDGIRLEEASAHEVLVRQIRDAVRSHRPDIRVAWRGSLSEARSRHATHHFVEVEDQRHGVVQSGLPSRRAVRRIRELLASAVTNISYRSSDFTAEAFDAERLGAALSISGFPFLR